MHLPGGFRIFTFPRQGNGWRAMEGPELTPSLPKVTQGQWKDWGSSQGPVPRPTPSYISIPRHFLSVECVWDLVENGIP